MREREGADDRARGKGMELNTVDYRTVHTIYTAEGQWILLWHERVAEENEKRQRGEKENGGTEVAGERGDEA